MTEPEQAEPQPARRVIVRQPGLAAAKRALFERLGALDPDLDVRDRAERRRTAEAGWKAQQRAVKKAIRATVDGLLDDTDPPADTDAP